MILEVKQYPDNKAVVTDPEWFPISAAEADKDPLGQNCMARILIPRRVGTSVKKGPLVDISTGEVIDDDAGKRQD